MRRSRKRCPTEPVHPTTPGHCQIGGCYQIVRHTDRTFFWGSREFLLFHCAAQLLYADQAIQCVVLGQEGMIGTALSF